MFNLFKKKKVVIIGLDGTPYSMLKDLTEKGKMPNVANISSQGYFGSMTVTLPEISSVSWSSFMTGKNSGTHGIYGFIDLRPNSYQIYFPNFSDQQVFTFFDELGIRDKKSIVINLPATYPARPFPGILISGFVAIDLKKAVYPEALFETLKNFDYRTDIDTAKARQDHDFLIKDLDQTLKIRTKVGHYLWDEFKWDLFMLVITGTDRLHHFLFDAYTDEKHPHHTTFIEYYQKVDQVIGSFYEKYLKLDEPKYLFMLSDHGFTKIETEVYINYWLKENGYLRFSKEDPEMIADLAPGTKAFALDPSRIYINTKGKYPLGVIDKNEYGRLLQELKSAFLKLEFNGKPVIRRVFTKEEIYGGPCIDRAPDLILLPYHGFDLKGSVQKSAIFGRSGLQGMHTYDDAFFFSDKGEICESIFEIKSKIMQCLTAGSGADNLEFAINH